MLDPLEERAKRAKARVGKTIRDKWVLGDVIGVGGMATVYAATHKNNGRRAAVKMLHPELSVVPQIKTRFLREGYASNQVEHEGAVSVLDDDTAEDGAVFLVMELLEGETLEQRRLARGGRLDMLEVLWATDQLLDVLAAAHAKGIVHRDIKPDNLFLTKGAQLKVLDFGLARVRPTPERKGLTRTNVLMGTLDFMSPEQARGEWDKLDGRSDIWSVGATMFTLLSACPVYPSRTGEEQLQWLTTKPPRSIAIVAPELPAPVVRVVDRSLSFKPADRWPDALTMQEAVREAFAEVGGAGGEPPRSMLPGTIARPPGPGGPDFDSGVTTRWDPNAPRPEPGRASPASPASPGRPAPPAFMPPAAGAPPPPPPSAGRIPAAMASGNAPAVMAPSPPPAGAEEIGDLPTEMARFPVAAAHSPTQISRHKRPLIVGVAVGAVALLVGALGLWVGSRPAEGQPSPSAAASSSRELDPPAPTAEPQASAPPPAPPASASAAPASSAPSKKGTTRKGTRRH